MMYDDNCGDCGHSVTLWHLRCHGCGKWRFTPILIIAMVASTTAYIAWFGPPENLEDLLKILPR